MQLKQQIFICMLWLLPDVIFAGRKSLKEFCPSVCESQKCPNIGPIRVSECPEPYIVTYRCGCCKRCDIQYITTTISPSKRDEVCQKFTCPKKKLCVLNMQGLPVCKCPSEDLCRKVTRRRLGKRNKVCGSDGVTYATRCHLKVASCKSDKKIRVVSRGDCTHVKSLTTSRPVNHKSVNDIIGKLENNKEMLKSDAPGDKRAKRKNKKRKNRRLAKRMRRKQRTQQRAYLNRGSA